MFQVQRLMQRPRSFESLCGLTPTEFTHLAQRLEPLWVRAHRLSLLRMGRQRQIGAGRQFKLDVPHRLFLTLLYLRRDLPMHLLGVLFEMDVANVCRNIHALLPLLKQSRLPPRLPRGSRVWGDRGYKGLDKLCPQHEVIVPRMRPKGGRLSPDDRELNHQISKVRITVENVVCKIKKFRVCRECYRNDPRNHGQFWGYVAGPVNLRTVDRAPQFA